MSRSKWGATYEFSSAVRDRHLGCRRGTLMPVTYRYDEFANRLVTRCEGPITYADVVEHFRHLTRDVRLKPNCDVLLDFTFLVAMPTAQQVSQVATALEDMRELVPFGRCAVVAPEDVMYGLGRMFQGFAWPTFTGMRVFRTQADSINWLNEEPD
jgi:hypothetical protein